MITGLLVHLCIVGYFAHGMPKPPDSSNTRIRLYKLDEANKMSWRAEDLSDGLQLFHDQSYNRNQPTMLIAHGWFQHAEDPVVVELMESIFKVKFYEKMNIMVLDSPYFMDSPVSNVLYLTTLLTKLEMLGESIADMFNGAIKEGLITADQINLVGLSLGAQLSGYVGRAVTGKIYSIVGLDPAGPGFDSRFQNWTKLQHVSKSDAQFVHLYHTNSVTFGTNQRLGTADFEFNEGFSQPGCAMSIDPKCSHKRAFFIFIDIILGDNKLKALKCGTQADFKECKCRGQPEVILKYPVDTRAEGTYYLRTAPEAPFGLGKPGVSCWGHHLEELEKQEMDESPLTKTIQALQMITETIRKTWNSE
ncbi:phospholipase A1-like [Macrosteles quadrilineatus]|uniref:phospholipase A1-like n=1 Tax=Macrosteles quadrilineatus TaxID=74068 RepID=UPI0023E17FD5|nr:phospholipase A1-like [Macrosteles quadrilineatus]